MPGGVLVHDEDGRTVAAVGAAVVRGPLWIRPLWVGLPTPGEGRPPVGLGEGTANVLTCDLSEEYIRINGSYSAEAGLDS